jgi:hypothetical protein
MTMAANGGEPAIENVPNPNDLTLSAAEFIARAP